MRTPVQSHTGHRNFLTNIIEECNLIYQDCTVDLITPIRVWDKDFTVDLESMSPENKAAGIPVLNAPGILVFTDGSQKNGRTGAGVVFYSAGVPVEIDGAKLIYSFRLRDQNSVFQSEAWAIKKATEILLNNIYSDPPLGQAWIRAGRQIHFYTDSQSTLKALASPIVKSRLIKETIELLNKLATVASSVTLSWVRGHDGHLGNVRADKAALEGRTIYEVFSPDSPDPPLAALKLDCDKAASDFWKASWRFEEGKTCSQTRLWFPNGPRPDFAFDILRLPRVICSQVLQFVTGHSFLNRHQALIDNAERDQIDGLLSLLDDNGEEVIPPSDPTCRRCGKGEEKPEHLMTHCEPLADLRRSIFGHPFPEPPYDDFKVYQLVAFLKQSKLPSLEMRPYLEQYDPTSIPEEARPTPPAPIVDGAEPISSDEDDNSAARRAAEVAGGKLLHNYLYTTNELVLGHDPKTAIFY